MSEVKLSTRTPERASSAVRMPDTGRGRELPGEVRTWRSPGTAALTPLPSRAGSPAAATATSTAGDLPATRTDFRNGPGASGPGKPPPDIRPATEKAPASGSSPERGGFPFRTHGILIRMPLGKGTESRARHPHRVSIARRAPRRSVQTMTAQNPGRGIPVTFSGVARCGRRSRGRHDASRRLPKPRFPGSCSGKFGTRPRLRT